MLQPLSWRYWWGLEKTKCNSSDPASCKRIISGLFYTFAHTYSAQLELPLFNFSLDFCLIFYFSLTLKHQLFSPENINNISFFEHWAQTWTVFGGILSLRLFRISLEFWVCGGLSFLKCPKNSLTDYLPCFVSSTEALSMFWAVLVRFAA